MGIWLPPIIAFFCIGWSKTFLDGKQGREGGLHLSGHLAIKALAFLIRCIVAFGDSFKSPLLDLWITLRITLLWGG